MRWSRGQVVVRRDRWWHRTWYAMAAIAVEDTDVASVIYAPAGAECRGHDFGGTGLVERLAGRAWVLTPKTRFNHTLAIHRPGDMFSLLLFWDDDWQPLSWYINIEAPHRRSAVGYDTCDHQLDVVMSLERQEWSWKDEDHLEAAVDAGLYTRVEASGIRRAGERAVALIQRAAPPFDDSWIGWRPDPSWGVPELPPEWDGPDTGRLGFVVPVWDPCPFCNNVAGIASPTAGLPSVVAEDELTYTFVAPVSQGGIDGHVLVIPRRHVETLLELTTDEAAALGVAVSRASRAVHAALEPDGILVVQRNAVGAQQDVPHVHYHVIPRHIDAPYPPTEWQPRIPHDRRHELAARLRAHL